MPKESKESVKLTGRITESKSPKKDIEFVKNKLDQGIKQAAIVRKAVSIYRKYEEGKLYDQTALESNLAELLSQNKELDSKNSKADKEKDEDQNKVKEPQDQERSIDERQAKELESELNAKLETGNLL